MSFRDLEKNTQKIEDKNDVRPEVDLKNSAPDLPDPALPSKPKQDTTPQGRNDDLFDNMPV